MTTDVVTDLEILHPERYTTLSGVAITVREYGFIEGMRLNALTAPIVSDLAQAFKSETLPDYAAVVDILARHVGVLPSLIAKACDQTPEWVEALSAQEGEMLTLLWWAANGRFFTQVAQRQATLSLLDGGLSTQHSSNTGTTSTESENTQSVN